MKSSFKLINSYYWKGFFGPFFSIVFPILVLYLMGSATYSQTLSIAIGSSDNQALLNSYQIEQIEFRMLNTARSIVTGVLVTSIISNGLIGFPTVIIEFKDSTLIKRIGSANIKKSDFMIATILYQLAWTIFALVWVPLWGTIILGFKKYSGLSVGFNMGLLAGIPFILLVFLVSIAMGLLIVSLVNTRMGVSSVSNLVYLPISFLSGGFGTGKLSLDYAPSLNVITYCLPTKYSTDLLFDITNANGYSTLLSNYPWQTYAYPVISLAIVALFIFISIKTFKWGE